MLGESTSKCVFFFFVDLCASYLINKIFLNTYIGITFL